MSSKSIFNFGALESITRNYEIPELADKKMKYICPDCDEILNLRQGKINKWHFSHKQNSNCNYYSSSISNIESKVHRYGKHKLQKILQSNKIINIYKKCLGNCRYNNPNKLHNRLIIDTKNQNYKTQLEYPFKHNNKTKRADVVLLENEKLLYIFEIYHTHKTNENDRHEPWFEFDATHISNVNLLEPQIDLICDRHYVCDNCVFELEKRRLEFIKKEEDRIEAERIKEHLRIEAERIKEEQRIKQEFFLKEQRIEAERIKEQQRIEAERIKEQQRIEAERIKELQRIEAERIKEQQRIADEKIKEEQRIKREFFLEERRIESERIREKHRKQRYRLRINIEKNKERQSFEIEKNEKQLQIEQEKYKEHRIKTAQYEKQLQIDREKFIIQQRIQRANNKE